MPSLVSNFSGVSSIRLQNSSRLQALPSRRMSQAAGFAGCSVGMLQVSRSPAGPHNQKNAMGVVSHQFGLSNRWALLGPARCRRVCRCSAAITASARERVAQTPLAAWRRPCSGSPVRRSRVCGHPRVRPRGPAQLPELFEDRAAGDGGRRARPVPDRGE
jgi:hypothetical protein